MSIDIRHILSVTEDAIEDTDFLEILKAGSRAATLLAPTQMAMLRGIVAMAERGTDVLEAVVDDIATAIGIEDTDDAWWVTAIAKTEFMKEKPAVIFLVAMDDRGVYMVGQPGNPHNLNIPEIQEQAVEGIQYMIENPE